VAGDYLEAFTTPAAAGAEIQDLVREVNITLTPEGEQITPAVGTEGATTGQLLKIFAAVKSLKRRTNNLERG
jgi:hypothetical protein